LKSLENLTELNFSLLVEAAAKIALSLGCFRVGLPNRSHWDFWL